MTTTLWPIAGAAFGMILTAAPLGSACGDYGIDPRIEELFDPLLSARNEADAIADLRSRGEAGLNTLLRAGRGHKNDPRFARIVDAVAKQRDALRSRLYWHTDFSKAKEAANASHRPILTLRLLGQLDEEFSCANSRLFREVLYANPEVSNYLREHFVLHWQSVRPVPVMTIDFGDGRVLKRTITGNSAHYVLDTKGRVVDALPGLYTPEAFLENLKGAEAFAQEHGGLASGWAQIAGLAAYHSKKLSDLETTFVQHLENAGLVAAADRLGDPIEMSDLRPEEWARLAEVPADLARFKLVAAEANDLTVGKGRMETPLIATVRTAIAHELKRTDLERATAEDSVRNEYVFRRRIHERLSKPVGRTDLAALNSWIYADLFKTPESDPWLGLNTPDVFTGLENNGVVAGK